MERKLHMASINKVCRKKEYGGMGIFDVESWNIGAYCRLIYKALTSINFIWASWIREYKLKQRHFWIMEAISDCSWSLRGLLRHRKVARELIKYVIANGEDTYFWHDIWCTSSPLLEDVKAVQTINLPLDTMVSYIITNGS